MIQRQQTLWLLLAAIFSFLGFGFPFYSGAAQVIEKVLPGVNLLGDSTILLFLVTLLTGGTALIALFLYKKRKLQLKVTLLGIVLSIVLIILYFKAMKDFDNGHILLTSLFTFLVPICFIMAFRGIRHDEKLVKSLDKLR